MDKITIETPEHIELEYELAGLGSRFVGIFIDSIIQSIMIAILVIILLLTEPNIFEKGPIGLFSSIFASAIVVLIFLVLFGYFIFFETLWTGQTPGKRTSQIQVIKDNGEPVRFVDSLIRNMFRIVDFLPAYYVAGIIMILMNKQNKRIGDMVAKTIVVRLKHDLKPTVLPDIKVRSDLQIDIHKISEEEYGLVRNFLIRRNDILPNARQELSKKIGMPLMKKLEIDPAQVDFEELLEVIAIQYKEQKKSL